MGVSGLAEGFLAGFNTMDRYQRGQQEEIRQERELGLRDAMVKQNKEDSDRSFSLRQAEFDNAVEQQKTAKEQWGQEFDLKKKEVEGLRAYRNANLGFAQAAESRDKESHALMMEKNARDQWMLDYGPAYNVAVSAAMRNEQLTPEQIELLNHPYVANRNPFKVFGDQGWHEASGRVFGSLKGLLNNPEARVWDERKLYGEINTDQNRKDFTYLFKNDLDKSIGTMTPNGSVKGYDNLSIVPTGRGTFYFDATVTYADPKTGKDVVMEHVPITEGRTSDPKDPVREFTGDQLIKRIGQGYQLSRYVQQNPQQVDDYLIQMGLKTPPDYKGLKTALAGLYKQEAKALADGGDPATVKAAFDEARENLPSVYGVGTGGAHNESSGENNNTGIASQWASQDPVRAGILDEARRNGIPIDSVKDSAQLDALLAAYNKAKQASSTAGRIRGETAKTAPRTSLSQANHDSKTQRAGAYSQEYRKPLEMESGALSLRDLESPFSLPSNDAYVPAWARGPAK